MNCGNSHEEPYTYLHERPFIQRMLALLKCRLRGGHKPFYAGRVFLGWTPFQEKSYLECYLCEHCQKDMSKENFER